MPLMVAILKPPMFSSRFGIDRSSIQSTRTLFHIAWGYRMRFAKFATAQLALHDRSGFLALEQHHAAQRVPQEAPLRCHQRAGRQEASHKSSEVQTRVRGPKTPGHRPSL